VKDEHDKSERVLVKQLMLISLVELNGYVRL